MTIWRPPQWLATSVRNKLLAMALLPLLVAFPLLVLALTIWSDEVYDRLLKTKVQSDLAVARGYFDQVLIEAGAGTRGVAGSHRLLRALQQGTMPGAEETSTRETLQQRLASARRELSLDFLQLYQPDGQPLANAEGSSDLPPLNAQLAQLFTEARLSAIPRAAQLVVLDSAELSRMAPQLRGKQSIPLVPTLNAAPDDRKAEGRAMVVVSVQPVRDVNDQLLAFLVGGLLLNQNLDFIDHINRIVYPDGALPFGSQGTATLFLDDVRITTNVRLFQNQRAVGTRVSQTVRSKVLEEGKPWFDRAFVVNDWYMSGYEPLYDAEGQRIGMLYVGFLEAPFRFVRYAVVALIGLIFLAVMLASAWFSVRWARSIFRPVEQMNRTMQSVEEGDATARVGPLPARDELGALAGHLDQLLEVIDDKTNALREWGEALDHKVAERTQELSASNASLKLAQQQLVKSEKMAAIGQLTASIAHEINNPIAVMQGNIDLMRETLAEHALPVKSELKLLDQQIERMRLIVTQLLQYSRPTEYAGYIESLDLNRAVSDCLVLVSHLLSHTHIRIEQNLMANTPVAFNRQELQQVIINLMINAIQAMPDGGVLTLTTRDRAGADSADATDGLCAGADLLVSDSGKGIAPDAFTQLFRPFYTTKNDGNGLGLWISVGLVERYGGRISAVNREDGSTGAVFTVQLLHEARSPGTVSTRDGRPAPG